MGNSSNVSLTLRRSIPLLIAFLLTIILLVDYFITGSPEVSSLSKTALSWTTIVSGFALWLGAVAVLIYHGRKVQEKEGKQRFYSLWTIIMFVTFAAVGLALGPSSQAYTWMYLYILGGIVATVNGLSVFYYISAAYRGLRGRSIVAIAATVSAAFSFLGQAPIGPALWSPFGDIYNWIWGVPGLAGSRGIVIVGGLGLILLGLRAIIGRERGFLR